MDKSLLDAAVGALSIQAVYLRSTEVVCKDGFLPQFIEDDLDLVPQYRVGSGGRFQVVTAAEGESGPDGRYVLFYFAADVRLIDGEVLDAAETPGEIPGEMILVSVHAEFCAQYRLDDAADAEALGFALEEFGRFSVGCHVWPYWREYVQSVCNRMGIPPIPVPMYRILQTEPEAGESAEAGPEVSVLERILQQAEKRRFAESYEAADAEARELVRSLVERVRAGHPEVEIYPTDTPDLRFNAGGRVAATLDLRKRAPYLRLNLLAIPDAIRGTRLEFRRTGDSVLPARVVIGGMDDLDDALLYLERCIANALRA